MAYSAKQLEIIQRRLMTLREQHLEAYRAKAAIMLMADNTQFHSLDINDFPKDFFNPESRCYEYKGVYRKLLGRGLTKVDERLLEEQLDKEITPETYRLPSINASSFLVLVDTGELVQKALDEFRMLVIADIVKETKRTKAKIDYFIEGLVMGATIQQEINDASFFDTP
jgi:hypothetical protein